MRKGIQHCIRPGATLLPLVLGLTACASGGGGLGTSPAPELAGTQWTVVEIDGRAPIGSERLTAQFGVDGRVAGNSGCNQFSGPYIQDGSSVRFGELLSTRRACVDEDRQRQENRVLAILGGETTVRRDRRELRVRGVNGVLILAPSA